MVFRLEPKNHQDISDLGAMSIPTAKGIVQLNQVAYLSYENEDGMIWRRNLLPTVTVNAGIIDSVTGNDVTKEIWEASAEMRKNLPFGVNIEIDGPSEKSAKSLTSILRPVPFMLIIMLVLLMIMLMDVRKVFVVMCISPLGLIGVFLGLFLAGGPDRPAYGAGDAAAESGNGIRHCTFPSHYADGPYYRAGPGSYVPQ